MWRIRKQKNFRLSFIFWGLVATSISIFLKAFGIAIVSVTMPFFILLAQIVGFLIPTPGYIGPFHAATVMALSFYGVSGELALSVAIIMHAMMFVTNTMLGFIYLWFENINLTTITREVKLDLLKTNYNSEKYFLMTYFQYLPYLRHIYFSVIYY